MAGQSQREESTGRKGPLGRSPHLFNAVRRTARHDGANISAEHADAQAGEKAETGFGLGGGGGGGIAGGGGHGDDRL